MRCPRCNNDKIYKDGKDRNGIQKYKCPKCGKYFNENTAGKESAPNPLPDKSKVGMSLNDFRSKFDVEFIVEKTLSELKKDVIYEKNDVYKLTGLRAGYPGLSATLEDKKFSQYRGRTGGKDYFSHPDTIKQLIEEAILQ
jgi:uncharacterized C2H2 Zn-finger protein